MTSKLLQGKESWGQSIPFSPGFEEENQDLGRSWRWANTPPGLYSSLDIRLRHS